MRSEIVHTIAYEEPEELLAALRGSNDEFWDGIPEVWVFRGHADAAWELLPAALRNNAALTHHPEKPPGPYATTESQIGVEAEKVLRFAEIANRRGLGIPGGWSAARRLLSRTVESKNTFPPFELWELFALAQHHGVPTRFLDWSRVPLVAAYFAAYGAAEMLNRKQPERPEHLAIWALNTTALWREPSSGEAVHLVDPSRYGNRNLTAQDGIFTVHVYSWSPNEAPRCEPLDSTVERLQPEHGTGVGRAKMRLLTLPTRKARKLLGRLESESISASTLFPGYDGVVRSIVEEVTHSDSAWRSPARED